MSSSLKHIRIASISNVYELTNLPKLQTFLQTLKGGTRNGYPSAVVMPGNLISAGILSCIDSGRGVIATLREAGITHACLGNNDADWSWTVLEGRIRDLTKGGSVAVINTNVRQEIMHKSHPWILQLMPEYSMIKSDAGDVNMALLGLMSDERDLLPEGGMFKNFPVSNVLETLGNEWKRLLPSVSDFVIPMTHQSLQRDRDLAYFMLHKLNINKGVIIGSHDHDPVQETVTALQNGSIHIVKSGYNAEHVALVDLTFDVSSKPAVLMDVATSLIDITHFTDSEKVKFIADKHTSRLHNIHDQILISEYMFPSPSPVTTTLSSKGATYRQTTVGGLFCQAIKEELEVDAAILDSTSVNGDTTYHDNKITCAQLETELAISAEIVILPMSRSDLSNVRQYARRHDEHGNLLPSTSSNQKPIPRKQYLQVDFDTYEQNIALSWDTTDIIRVAVPLHLLNESTSTNKPLVCLGKQFLSENPSYNIHSAIDLITRHCFKAKWIEIAKNIDKVRFRYLDSNFHGSLARNEIKSIVKELFGYVPNNFILDGMIRVVDADGDGKVDAGELSYILATFQRGRH